jgi:predicted short-subunit dehydrogenase-like oxidoreductase (DUF2520 family)
LRCVLLWPDFFRREEERSTFGMETNIKHGLWSSVWCGGTRKLEPDSAILPGMAAKPRIAIVGAGKVGGTLAVSLQRAGYSIDAIVTQPAVASLRRASRLARQVGSRAVISGARIKADVIWFCVPDGEIASAAQSLALQIRGQPIVALHSSGLLSSDQLDALRSCGANVASVHPLMSFVLGSRPSLAGVSFAIEGDAAAVRMAKRIVKDLRGEPFLIRRKDKAAYHAWATFASPLLTALLATTERVAVAAGVRPKLARRRVMPIVSQTVVNYATLGAPASFSGPLVRGDVKAIGQHLGALRRVPPARDAYKALARAALQYLPTKNRKALAKFLKG